MICWSAISTLVFPLKKSVFFYTIEPQCVYVSVCKRVSLTLCNPIVCSLPGSSVHETFQARVLEWFAFSCFRGSSWPRDQTQVSVSPTLVGRFFITGPPAKPRATVQWLKSEKKKLTLPNTITASLVAQMVKHLPAMRETRVRFLGWEDPLEKEMTIHSSTLAWKILWMEEPDRLQSMGLQRVRHDWATSLHFNTITKSITHLQILSNDPIMLLYIFLFILIFRI